MGAKDIILGLLRVAWRCEKKADEVSRYPTSQRLSTENTLWVGRDVSVTSPTGRCEKKADDAPRTPLLKVDHDLLGICSFEVAGSTMRSTLRYGGMGEDALQKAIGFFFALTGTRTGGLFFLQSAPLQRWGSMDSTHPSRHRRPFFRTDRYHSWLSNLLCKHTFVKSAGTKEGPPSPPAGGLVRNLPRVTLGTTTPVDCQLYVCSIWARGTTHKRINIIVATTIATTDSPVVAP